MGGRDGDTGDTVLGRLARLVGMLRDAGGARLARPFVRRHGRYTSLQFSRAQTQSRMLTADPEDRKSTRLNSSHVKISYAVFCLKKKTFIISRNILLLYF